MAKGPFKHDPTFITTTTDRHEIFIDLRIMEDNEEDLLDLRWLVPYARQPDEVMKALLHDQAIKSRKTIVLFDSRNLVGHATRILRKWLQQIGVSGTGCCFAFFPFCRFLTKAGGF